MWDAMKATSTPKRLDEPNYDYKHRLLERIAELEELPADIVKLWEDREQNFVAGDDSLAYAMMQRAKMAPMIAATTDGKTVQLSQDDWTRVNVRMAALEMTLAAYVADEDRFNAGKGEPYGSISTDVGMRARAILK